MTSNDALTRIRSLQQLVEASNDDQLPLAQPEALSGEFGWDPFDVWRRRVRDARLAVELTPGD